MFPASAFARVFARPADTTLPPGGELPSWLPAVDLAGALGGGAVAGSSAPQNMAGPRQPEAAQAAPVRAGDPASSADSNAFARLTQATVSGDEPMVRALLQSGAYSNARTEDGLTPLMLAAHQGHAGIIRVLTHWQADMNALSPQGIPALTMAAANGHVHAVTALLEAHAVAGMVHRAPGLAATDGAPERGHGDAALAGSEAHMKAGAGRCPSALMVAALNGHDNVVAALREAGADIHAHLLAAAYVGRSDIIGALVRAGADVSAVNERGLSALMLVARCGHLAAIHALLLHGADINAADEEGWTATICAVVSGNANAVKALMREENDIDVGDANDSTALLMAAAMGHLEIVNELLRAGGDFKAINRDHCSAAMLAAANRNLRVIKALRQAGADIDIDLPRAARLGTAAMVQNLIRAGASLAAMEEDGMTAMMLAVDARRFDVIDILQKTPLARGVVASRARLAAITEEPGATVSGAQDDRLDAAQAACSAETSPASASQAMSSGSAARQGSHRVMQDHVIGDGSAGKSVLQRPATPMAPWAYV